MDESLIEQKPLKNHWRKELVISRTKLPVPLTARFNRRVMFSPRVSQIHSFAAYFSFNFEKFIVFLHLCISAVLPTQLNSEVGITELERRVSETG